MSDKPEVEVAQAKLNTAYSQSAHPTVDSEQAEKKRRAAVAPETAGQRNEKMIAALLRERAGLQQAGKDARLAQVDEQLHLYGYSEDSKTQTRKQPPQGRSVRPQQTNDKPLSD